MREEEFKHTLARVEELKFKLLRAIADTAEYVEGPDCNSVVASAFVAVGIKLISGGLGVVADDKVAEVLGDIMHAITIESSKANTYFEAFNQAQDAVNKAMKGRP